MLADLGTESIASFETACALLLLDECYAMLLELASLMTIPGWRATSVGPSSRRRVWSSATSVRERRGRHDSAACRRGNSSWYPSPR